MTKIFLNEDVLTAAKARIARLYEEFDSVVVSFSGGKDSTVVLNLAIEVATQLNKLPVDVLFLDQEAEWTHVVNYIRRIQKDKRVNLHWFQIPFKLYNSNSYLDTFFEVWSEEKKDEWIREKEEKSIKENIFNKDRFHDLFFPMLRYIAKGKNTACYLTGVRAQESPSRLMGLTHAATYKDITWGKKEGKDQSYFTFHPIYDWDYSDVWKYIHENKYDYCELYNEFYRFGVKVRDMRVSSLTHKTAATSVELIHELDKDLWFKISSRVAGLASNAMLKHDFFRSPDSYPRMFTSWIDYRDYLLDKFILDPKIKNKYIKKFEKMEEVYKDLMYKKEDMYKAQINSILQNDDDFLKINTWETRPEVFLYRKQKKGYKLYDSGGLDKYVKI